MISNKEVIERIDSLLKKRNLKRNAVYDVVGLPHNTFSNWQRNESVKIPAQALLQIANFFNVSVEYLLTGKERVESIPQDVLNLAYEIQALPPPFQKIIKSTLETLKETALEKEQEEKLNIG